MIIYVQNYIQLVDIWPNLRLWPSWQLHLWLKTRPEDGASITKVKYIYICPHQSCTYYSLTPIESVIHIFVYLCPITSYALFPPANLNKNWNVRPDFACAWWLQKVWARITAIREPVLPKTHKLCIALRPCRPLALKKCCPIHPVLISRKLEYIPNRDV